MNWTNALVHERLLAHQTAAAEARLVARARAAGRSDTASDAPVRPTRRVRGIWFPGRPLNLAS